MEGRQLAAILLASAGMLLLASPEAEAAGCPPIEDKPGAVPHVDYDGVQHLTYCYGPIDVAPGQNIIRLKATNLFPDVPGYITRFDPELVYEDGTVPRVDVLHLHHAVWLINGNPQFATGEEKTIMQLPEGFGWRSRPTDSWLVNDMLHDLVGVSATVYVVWRIDFVPDTAPDASSIHQVRTKWMDVAGPDIYPVFDALRGMGDGGRYTFPDEATGPQRDLIGAAGEWTPNHALTLISTAGHLHPGGLKTSLRVERDGERRTLFDSVAHYYEPAGAVSWDVAMGGTPPNWRVKVEPGDTLSINATYDTDRADWYEVMGIMPVAVYDGTDVGGVDALAKGIPRDGVLTHGHLAENRNHGGDPTGLPDATVLPSAPAPAGPIGIEDYTYGQGDLATSAVDPPTVAPGETLTFLNHDAEPAENTFHTITSCRAPCNASTGIAYPIADGPTTFDSGQLGFNYAGFGAPAADRDTWTTSDELKQGTYNYFCRIHPFMRGSFRVAKPRCQGVATDWMGTRGKDRIKGTREQDGSLGLAGKDMLAGRRGDDGLCGGGGNDKLKGGPGDDKLNGGPGKDKCRGGPGDDTLINCER
jgi:plastocyanin